MSDTPTIQCASAGCNRLPTLIIHWPGKPTRIVCKRHAGEWKATAASVGVEGVRVEPIEAEATDG